MQKIIFQIIKTPYIYILLGILLIIILCILFHRKIKVLLEDINIRILKTNTLTIDCTTAKNSRDNTSVEIKNVKIENSNIGDVGGKVSIDNAKIKESTIGSIRGN